MCVGVVSAAAEDDTAAAADLVATAEQEKQQLSESEESAYDEVDAERETSVSEDGKSELQTSEDAEYGDGMYLLSKTNPLLLPLPLLNMRLVPLSRRSPPSRSSFLPRGGCRDCPARSKGTVLGFFPKGSSEMVFLHRRAGELQQQLVENSWVVVG